MPVKATMPAVRKVITKVQNTRAMAKGLGFMLNDVPGSGMTIHKAANLKMSMKMIEDRPVRFMNKAKDHFDKVKKFLKEANKWQ